jgi:hypothetical protein
VRETAVQQHRIGGIVSTQTKSSLLAIHKQAVRTRVISARTTLLRIGLFRLFRHPLCIEALAILSAIAARTHHAAQ